MSTPPLLELPTSSCVASVIMTISRVVGYTESPFTLQGQTFKWPGERWSISFRMPPFVARGVAMDWVSFGAKLKGRYGLFLMGDPSAKKPRGVATGNPEVDGGGQVGNTLLTKGWTPNVTGIFLKGDYLQIGSGANSRLYMNVEDVNSDSSGNAALSLEPELRNSPADGAIIIVQNAKGVFRLTSNDFSWSVEPGPVYRVSFEATEAL